jgi:lysine-specific demethylase/histidyl-hydroxylase NO66
MKLGELLDPLPPAVFLERYWQRQPLLVPGDASRFAGLMSARDIPWLLQSHRPRPPADILLVKGSAHHARRWTYDDGTPKVDQVQAAWREGYTLVVNAVHKPWQPIARFAAALEESLHHPVSVNLYFTPPGSQGFLPHYDVMDGFILQLEGTKAWQVREPVVELPLPDEQRAVSERELPPVVLEGELVPGSVLYMPRGFVHAARTSTTSSLHLTVGVQVVTWLDLLAQAVRGARGDRRLREALEPGFFAREAHLAPVFEALLRELPGLVDLQGALQQVAERVLVDRPRVAGLDFTPVEEIGPGTVVERAGGALQYMSQAPGQAAIIQYPGGKIVGPAKIAPALRHIATQQGSFTVGSLPDSLAASEKIVLVRRLVHEGLLRIVPGAGA